MKPGDYLLCKNSLYLTFDKDNYYKINKITKDFILIEAPPRTDNYFTNKPIQQLIRFEIDYYDTFGNFIWNYFYTPIELRKLKLIQLNKCGHIKKATP